MYCGEIIVVVLAYYVAACCEITLKKSWMISIGSVVVFLSFFSLMLKLVAALKGLIIGRTNGIVLARRIDS